MTSAELKHQTKLQEWAAQIQNCRSSGLPVRAWCRQEGINASTYYRWERELLTAADQAPCSAVPAMTFAELPEPKKMSRNVPQLLSHACLCAGRFDAYRQIDIFGTSLPIIPQNRPPYGENADSAPRRKRAGSAKKSRRPREGSPQPVEKPRLRIRRQPGFRHIMGKTVGKAGNGQSHSISTLPVF